MFSRVPIIPNPDSAPTATVPNVPLLASTTNAAVTSDDQPGKNQIVNLIEVVFEQQIQSEFKSNFSTNDFDQIKCNSKCKSLDILRLFIFISFACFCCCCFFKHS